MELVRTILNLRFTTAFRPWLDIRSLVRVLGDQPSAELEGPPLVIALGTKRERVTLQFSALGLEQEGAGSVDDKVTRALDLVTNVNAAVSLPPIFQMRYDSIFIDPYTLPFHELVVLMKDEYLRSNPVVDPATDIGLTFDQHEGDVIKHLHIGPMEMAQLNSMYLAWPRKDLPEQFVFASLGYEQRRETVFDANHMREFLETAVRWQTDQAKKVTAYIRKEGV